MSTSLHHPLEFSPQGAFISWIFPPTCPVCLAAGESGVDLCRACLAELPVLSEGCFSCADHLPESELPKAICGDCLVRPPMFDRTFAAFPYAPPIDGLIRQLKFSKQLYCARILGRLLAMRAMNAAMPTPDCFMPIPLHRQRLQQRGFNQSVEIVRTLSHCLQVPFDRGCLQRVGACVPQTALSADRRRQNPRGTFALARTPKAQFIVIVDDVMTTGSTVNEAARLLHKAGVARVEVWVVSRTRK